MSTTPFVYWADIYVSTIANRTFPECNRPMWRLFSRCLQSTSTGDWKPEVTSRTFPGRQL